MVPPKARHCDIDAVMLGEYKSVILLRHTYNSQVFLSPSLSDSLTVPHLQKGSIFLLRR